MATMTPLLNKQLPAASTPLAPAGGGRFAAVIFDMGSTLLEYENVPWPVLYPTSLESLHRRLKRGGRKPPDFAVFWERFNILLERRRRRIREQMREYRIGDLVRELLSGFGMAPAPGELSRLCDAYYAPIRRQVTVYPDARATLRRFHECGYKVGLLSNTCFRARDHREELVHHGLWSWIDAAVFTSTGTYRKPHPAPFRAIERRLGVPVGRCLMVGDRQYEDIGGAQQAGMTGILVRRRHRRYEPGLTHSAEIESLAELTEMLAY